MVDEATGQTSASITSGRGKKTRKRRRDEGDTTEAVTVPTPKEEAPVKKVSYNLTPARTRVGITCVFSAAKKVEE